MFNDRADAGRQLADRLEKFRNDNPVILAVPRGGVVVAYESIKRFGFEWDMIMPRKIGAPKNKELAIGAVSADGTFFVNEEYVEMLNIPRKYIEKEVAEQVKEIERRLNIYRGNTKYSDIKGKTAIIIDDGIATGFTILAAVKSIKNQGAEKTILAVPVAPPETVESFKEIVDEFICLLMPEGFLSVGMYYKNFEQVSDNEVFKIIKELRR